MAMNRYRPQLRITAFLLMTTCNPLRTAMPAGAQDFDLIPSGAVLAFDRETCPEGFSRLDGADGRPDGRGRFIVGAGETLVRGDVGGASEVALAIENLPPLDIPVTGTVELRAGAGIGVTPAASGAYLASDTVEDTIYSPGAATVPMAGDSIEHALSVQLGEGTPVSVVPPYLALIHCRKD